MLPCGGLRPSGLAGRGSLYVLLSATLSKRDNNGVGSAGSGLSQYGHNVLGSVPGAIKTEDGLVTMLRSYEDTYAVRRPRRRSRSGREGV